MSQPVFYEENTAAETTHGIPLRNLWYMLLYAWQELPHSPYWQAVADVDTPTLDALLASMLSRMLQQRLRIGLGCRYIPEKKLLRGIRGRIDFTDSLKKQTLPKGQAFCEYEHYSINALPNQIIRATLFRLAQIGDFGTDQKKAEALRHQLRFLVRTLAGVDLVELTPDLIRRQQTVRHDRDYRLMLSICEFVLRRRLPTEFEGEHFVTQLERERFVLHHVYEQFVANFYQYHLQDWRVQAQKTLYWHDKKANENLPRMRPDLVLEAKETGQLVVLDTKFTARSLKQNQWGKALFDSSHLYQMYAYLQTQVHLSVAHQNAEGILLYPTVRDVLSERIELPQQVIRIETVDLARPWTEIEVRLLGII